MKLVEYTFGSYVRRATSPVGVSGVDFTSGAGATSVITEGLGYTSTCALVVTNNTAATDASGAVTNAVYTEYKIGVRSGYAVQFTDLVMQVARGGAGTPRGYVVRSSIDNYASNIATADVSTVRPTLSEVTIDLASLGVISSEVTFRIYIYTPSASQSIDFDNVLFNGVFTSTPTLSTNKYSSYKELVEAVDAGKTCTYYWRKAPGVTVTQGIWYDLSIVPGLPAPQYYAATPMTATPMAYSSDRGLFHGFAPGKYLRETTVFATQNNHFPMNMYLLDYLMFYPFVDEGTTDVQPMTNVNTLPRYTDGEGVKIMLVTQGARAGAPYVTVTYTNQDGVSGRVTPLVRMNNEAYNGAIATSNRTVPDSGNPFIPLQSGDTGVRSVQSVTMNTADVGIFAVVLVKPIASTVLRELGSPSQKDYLLHASVLPEIQNDAYLNWVVCPNGIFNASIVQGDLTTIWT